MRFSKVLGLTAVMALATAGLQSTAKADKLDDNLVRRITEAAMKGWVLGDARFAAKIEKLSGRRATPLPKGRPRKQ